MASPHRRLTRPAFEKLREQLATASALCDDDQLLELADDLHESLRRRKGRRHESMVFDDEVLAVS